MNNLNRFRKHKRETRLTWIFAILLGVSWLVNFTKFVGCDFAPPYTCEIIHAASIVVAPASLVTAWVNIDEN